VFAKSKTKNVANKIDFSKSKEKDIITSLLKFAISETTLYCRHNIAIKSLSNSTFIEFKNLLIILKILDCKENNINRYILLF